VSRSRLLIAAAAISGTAVAVGVALAAGPTATEISVAPRVTILAPAVSPIDVGGVPEVRAGKALPTGYRLIGRRVTIKRGTDLAAAQIRLSCPPSTRSRGLLADNGNSGGHIYEQLWRTGRGRDQATGQAYDFHDVVAQAPPTLKVGESASGTVYILCRS